MLDEEADGDERAEPPHISVFSTLSGSAADGDMAAKILADLVERSTPFDTMIDVRNGRGFVRVR